MAERVTNLDTWTGEPENEVEYFDDDYFDDEDFEDDQEDPFPDDEE